MLYRRFGRTGLRVPVFSTGGMRYQDGWTDKPIGEIDPAVQANLRATIERSLAVGIHHIETARGYGPSERQLGLVLPDYPRESLIVQTKIGPTEEPAEFTAHVHESLDRLRLDHVDLLAIHGINNEATLHQAVRPGGCLDACYALRDAGLCKHIGFSTHGEPGIIRRAIEAHQPDGDDARREPGRGFDYLNVHWYYIFQRNAACIEAAHARDMGVFVISPTDKGGHLHTPSDRLRALTAPLHPIAFNDLWCLAQTNAAGGPMVHTLSLGAARPGDYDEHVEALSRMGEAAVLLPAIEARLEGAMRAATGDASPEAGLGALPEVYDVPGEVNVRMMLWLLRLSEGWGMQGYAKARFNLMGSAGHWFPGMKGADVAELDEAARRAVAAACAGYGPADELWARLDRAVDALGGEAVKRLSES